MKSYNLYNQVTLNMPFSLNGFVGNVRILYGANSDPRKVGFDALPGYSFDIQKSKGYPVMNACIDEYGGTGLRMYCGWIQIVTSHYQVARDSTTTGTEMYVSADMAPVFQDTGMPFAAFGYLPQLFDAPCLNLGSATELLWTADSFLTTVPMRSKEEEIEWLAGFRWGYSETNHPGSKPVLQPIEITDGGAWNQHLPYLWKQFGQWKFKTA